MKTKNFREDLFFSFFVWKIFLFLSIWGDNNNKKNKKNILLSIFDFKNKNVILFIYNKKKFLEFYIYNFF